MGLQDLISPESVYIDVKARCKRELLSQLAEAACGLAEADCSQIHDALMDRERLGSTGVGEGVAIPHGKIEGLSEIVGVLARLEEPIEFDAVDDQPVDLVFLLLAPADATAAHLKALAKVTRLLRDEDSRAALRGAETREALYAAATVESSRSNAA